MKGYCTKPVMFTRVILVLLIVAQENRVAAIKVNAATGWMAPCYSSLEELKLVQMCCEKVKEQLKLHRLCHFAYYSTDVRDFLKSAHFKKVAIRCKIPLKKIPKC